MMRAIRCQGVPQGAAPAARRAAAHAAAPRAGARPQGEVRLNSTLLPVVAPALALAAVNPVQAALAGPAGYFASLGLPEWLVHWGHPGNMAVVLAAMGFYGSGYLGWQIRTASGGAEALAKARDLHPKLALGMAFFFALGATGGMMSLIMQGKDIWQSPHATTGLVGLLLLGLQAILPSLFDDDPNARNMHAFLGTSILALFAVHAALGLQLGLSI